MMRTLLLLTAFALLAPCLSAQVTASEDFDEGAPEGWRATINTAGVHAIHGYNFDFDEGSWGARGFYVLPLDLPVGISGGIDYFPEDESNSLTVLGADLSYHLPMTLLGDGQAYGGFGPRYYRSSFDNGITSSSNSEFGFGAVLGATYPVGPVSIYGDIGTDRIFDEWNCFTRVGIGVEFGGPE